MPPVNEDIQMEVVDTIKLGDEEFTQEALEKLVGLGKIAQEVEEKYNTKIDKVYPAFTKTTQELSEMRNSKTQLEKDLEEMRGKLPADDDQVAFAKQQLKQFGVVFGDDLDKIVNERTSKAIEEKEAAKNLLDGIKDLQRDIEKDGKPPVETVELLEYMRDNPGLNDPKKAYKFMKEEQLDAWRDKQISNGKRPGLQTISSSQAGSKEPLEVRPNLDNLSKLMSEALGSNE